MLKSERAGYIILTPEDGEEVVEVCDLVTEDYAEMIGDGRVRVDAEHPEAPEI